ncbi:hypothetical protein ACRARG_11890 [Pseudooceanicola sp. C21-150M6]|uniref:hypothetical protein n=1 Tax=Pseudooceanicola sp. C21-150M6 TaxID=3434355 RepID=UPI003D7FAC54
MKTTAIFAAAAVAAAAALPAAADNSVANPYVSTQQQNGMFGMTGATAATAGIVGFAVVLGVAASDDSTTSTPDT